MSQSKSTPRLIDYLNKVKLDQTGYLKFSCQSKGVENTLYIGIVNGRVIYCNPRPFVIEDLFKTIRRYLIQSRNPSISNVLDRILSESSRNSKPLDKINQLIQSHIIDEAVLAKILHAQTLAYLDRYLYKSGVENFIPDSYLSAYLPTKGFGIKGLVETSVRRVKLWTTIEPVFKLSDVFTLKQDFISPKYFPLGQRELIMDLIKSGVVVDSIAERVARDSLEIAVMFLEMVNAGILAAPEKQKHTKLSLGIPPILAIDSSDSILTRIYGIIDKLGYPMIRCNDIDLAVEILRQKQPILVLIETKMLTFGEQELRKVIKENPNLAEVPIAVMSSQGQRLSRMTAEKYFEVQKPEDSGDLSKANFENQVSGLLKQLNKGI